MLVYAAIPYLACNGGIVTAAYFLCFAFALRTKIAGVHDLIIERTTATVVLFAGSSKHQQSYGSNNSSVDGLSHLNHRLIRKRI